MAKQRPTLGTFAQPVSNFVTPVDPEKTVAPLDQQAVRDTYAFADAFSSLSESMVKVASAIKTDLNKENAAEGMLLINQSRKSYADLEREGKIKPNENPWFALGAQQASGVIEAQKSSVEIAQLYEQQKKENPAFLEDSKGFEALVSSYMTNKSSGFGSAQTLAGAFFDNFNPSVAKLQQQNMDDIDNYRFSKYLNASRAKTDLTISAMAPGNYDQMLADIQLSYDEMVRNSPGRAGEIGQAYAAQLIDLMRSSERFSEAEFIFSSLRGGTGPLSSTEFSKSLMMKYGPEIEKNKRTSLSPEARKIVEKAQQVADSFDEGKYGAGAEAVNSASVAMKKFVGDISAGLADPPTGTPESASYLKAKRDGIADASRTVFTTLGKKFDSYMSDQAAEAKKFRENIASAYQLDLREKVAYGDEGPEGAKDAFFTMLDNQKYGFTPEEKLQLKMKFENDMSKMAADYEDGRARVRMATAENRVSEEVQNSLLDFASELAVNPKQTTATPLPVSRITQKVDELLRTANLTEEQRKKAKDRMYRGLRTQTTEAMTALFTKSAAQGGMAPFEVPSLDPNPNDSTQVSDWKSQARFAVNYANLQLDASFGQEDTIAKFRAVAAEQLNSQTQERGLTHDVLDLYRLWSAGKSGFLKDKLFAAPEGERVGQIFDAVQSTRMSLKKTSLQDAFVDALSMYTAGRVSDIEKWTKITHAQSGDRADYESRVSHLVRKFNVTNPDAIRMLEGMYAFEVVTEFGSGSKFNLALSLDKASSKVTENLVPIRGSFLPKVNGIGEGQFTEGHFTNLADFYAGNDAEAVFLPIDIDSSGNYIFVLRDKNGNTVQARLFTMDDLVSAEAYSRSTFHRLKSAAKDDGSEREYLKQKDGEYIDYSFSDEARIARQTRLFNLRAKFKKNATKGDNQ
jgi:hypothetical protein